LFIYLYLLIYLLRHEVKRHPLSYLAFGLGPRNCIGMKFAIVEMKLALVNLMRNFELFPSENTPKILETIEGIVRQPKNGIPLIFKKRN
jgi:cytochrome P450